jgi:hypothetical protein
LPQFERVLVKPAPEPQRGRLVVSGRGESVSTLGPPAEEPVAEFLKQLADRFAERCAS